ncbi:flagellar basal body P-ring formation chaperone FlgA [Sulfurimonas sp.]
MKNNTVMLSDIINVNQKNDKKLLQIKQNRHSLRIRTKDILNLLKKNGYLNYSKNHNAYIQFTKKSPINKNILQKAIQKFYKNNYKQISINFIELRPVSYLQSLPKNYTIHFQNRAYLSNKAIFYIKTEDRKEIFFNYLIHAKVVVFTPKNKIKKDTQLSNINCKKNSIMLDRFKAMPIQDIGTGKYQAKHTLRPSNVITKRDVSALNLIRRNSMINVFLDRGNMLISFSAKALQNGKLGDTIKVINSNGKKISVLVIGKNKAEVR